MANNPNNVNAYGPPFGPPQRALDTPNRGYSVYNCNVPDAEKLPHQLYPWLYPPPGFESFDRAAVVSITGAGVPVSTPTTILTLEVPEGWDGIVSKIANVYIGTGFTEASGDLTWAILVNGNQPVKNYGEIITTFGSVAQPRDISGFIVRSKQTVQYKFTYTNPGLAAGSVYAALSGYFWRMQGGTY